MTKTVFELAVERFFYDKQWRFLWKDFTSFNALPPDVQLIYCQEVHYFHNRAH